MPDQAFRPSYAATDVLTPEEVRVALAIDSDAKWKDVSARLPWSTALGARTFRIAWGRVLEWLADGERRVA